MNLAAASRFAVNRVRVVDRENDALRARMAVDRLLASAQPQVPGLPRAAILIVRRLADYGSGPCAGLTSPAAIAKWRTSVEDALVGLWRGAARPAHEPVPDSAPAVLFDDHAELLACLAADWAAGVAGARWWWRSLLGTRSSDTLDGTRAFVGVLRSHAADVPAMFELLARRRLAAAVARAVPPSEALLLAVAVAREHGIRVVRELTTAARIGSPGGPVAPPPVPASTAPGGDLGARARSRRAPAPWRSSVEEAAAVELEPAQRLLLGVALLIRRDPVAARAPGFWPAVETWWRHTVAAERDGLTNEVPARPGVAARPPTASRVSSSGSSPPAPLPPAWVAPIDVRLTSSRDPAILVGAPAADMPSLPVSELAASEPAVWTPHAGVFYLLNVALFLGLYGDFTMPRHRGLSLDPWDFAALVARRLLRTVDERDPIWRLLAGLSGHERAPGFGFRAPRCWRVPPEWLEPFDRARGSWRWSATDDRLRVVHAGGFAAIDLPVAPDPVAQLRRELARYATPSRVEPMRTPLRQDNVRGLARWTAWVAGYVSARLRIALGTRTTTAAIRTVLNRAGTVRVTATRVDVHFPLDDLPIAIRLAGLDRSPGWIPAAGRYLEFHFE